MIRTIVLAGQKHKLRNQDVLGSGGEATVVRVDSQAVKLYHTIDENRRTKLAAFTQIARSLPHNVCCPLDLVYDARGAIVGFSMRLVPVGFEVVQLLASKKFRRSNPKLNSRFITELFIDILMTFEKLHKQSVVVGDFNDLNIEFGVNQSTSFFIDADSFQFSRFPCMVGTEAYLDPKLYNLNLSAKPYFTIECDWYAFWAMYIRSLLMVHPYGGVHNQYQTIPQRALAGVTILDSSIKYPKVAFSLELLTPDLKTVIERVFGEGERLRPTLTLLQNYAEELIECPSCKVWFPGKQRSCPECANVNQQQIKQVSKITKSSDDRVVTAEELLKTSGRFIWSASRHSDIFAIALENDRYILYHRTRNEIKTYRLFGLGRAQARFDIFANRYLVYSKDQLSDDIYIYDLLLSQEVSHRVISKYHGRPIFSCTHNHLFRLQGQTIYRGSFHPSLGYVEQNVSIVMENQTWFSASDKNDKLFGFQRFFGNLQFFIYDFSSGTKFFVVNMEPLETDESIIGISVRFSSDVILVLFKTEIKGRTFSRINLIDSNGKLILSEKIVSLSSECYKSISGKAFVKLGQKFGILHPTDNGIVQEIRDPQSATQLILTETEPFVQEGDRLEMFGNGVLVTGDASVVQLILESSKIKP